MLHFINRYKEKLILGGIILLASYLRLNRIGDYLTFLGDEGRDVIIAKGILEGDLVLLGPRSSAADFFYGPIYYYLITPFLWLFQYDPVGPAVMVALVGIATVFLIYKVGTDIFESKFVGLSAAALYSVSPVIIAYSRSSWNPNPLPFVSLLILYLVYKAVQEKSLKLFLVIGILLGIGLQLQYLALFLATIVAFFVFFGSWEYFHKIDIHLLIKRYITIFLGFLIGFSPFLAFEVRHGFPNLKTILRYIFTDDLGPVNYVAPPVTEIIPNVVFRLFARLITRYPPPEQVNILVDNYILILYIVTLCIIALSLLFLFKIKNRLTFILMALWFLLGVGLFGKYSDRIYDYHFGFMFPLPFLLLGNALKHLYENRKIRVLKYVSLAILFGLLYFNFLGNPFVHEPNRQKDNVKKIAEFVLSKTDGQPFNFALLTGGNSDHGYRYFFQLANKNPVVILSPQADPQRKSVTDQLLIICEDPNCQPLGASLWEVAGFGRAEIVDMWPVSTVKVYKLRHYQEK